MKNAWILLLLLAFQPALGQKIAPPSTDSLNRKLSVAKEDTNKLVLLKDVARHYEDVDIAKSFMYSRQGLQLARKLGNIQYTCIFYDLFAEALINKSDYAGAIKKLDTAYAVATKHHELLSMAFACSDYGWAYENLGNYTRAQAYFFQCLALAEQLKNYKVASTAAINIGTIYANQQDNVKAIAYARRVLAMVKQYHLNGSIGETKAYELLGATYLQEKKYAAAAAGYQLALAIYSKDKNLAGEAICYGGLAAAYPSNYGKTLAYGLKAQAMWKKLAAQNLYAIDNLGNLGIAYGDLVRFNKWLTIPDTIPLNIRRNVYLQKAQSYLSKAIQMADATNTQYNVMTLTDSLAVLQSYLGNYKDAFKNITRHNILYDSIFSQSNKNRIAGIEEAHEVSLRDKQLEINRLQIANQQKQAVLLVGSLLLVICIAVLIYFRSQSRKQVNQQLSLLNQELDEANTTKAKFFGILNHDLKRPVSDFVTFRRLQLTEPGLISETGRQQYEQRITASAEHLLATMDDLLLWSKGQMKNFKPELRVVAVKDLFGYLERSFADSGIQLHFDAPADMRLHTDDNYLKSILQNLTNNAVRALSGTASPRIEWKAWTSGNDQYLAIADNGPGATQENLRALYDDTVAVGIQNGLGLHIVRDLARAIGCIVKVLPGASGGLTIRLKLAGSFEITGTNSTDQYPSGKKV